jgi:hypothetical protein
MHDPVVRTGAWLRSIVQGYFNYHAVPGNTDSLSAFRYRVIRLWRSTLMSRGQRHRLTWVRMRELALDKLGSVQLLDDRWRTAPNHSRPASCIIDPDVDAEDYPVRDPQHGQ